MIAVPPRILSAVLLFAGSVVSLSPSFGQESGNPNDKAAAEIQQIGGKIERDEKAEGKPVLVVYLATQPVTDDKLACLAPCGQLQKLTLNTTKITDAGLEHLKNLGQLKKLYLVDTAVTDAGLEKLQGLKSLEVLSLAGTQVSDTGLERLRALENLKLLFLAGTKVTDDGVKKLQEALPKLKIEK